MMMIYLYVELKFYVCCESVNVADQLRIVNKDFSFVLNVSTLLTDASTFTLNWESYPN